MTEAATNVLRCPQCGGETTLPSGERLLVCAFCDATLFVDRSGLVQHYRLPRLLDAGVAQEELRRWMAGNETIKGLDREAKVERAVPMLFPMWLFRLHREDGERVRVEPAAPTTEPGLTDLQVPAGELRPYQGEAEDEEVERVETQVPLATARGWLHQREGEGVEVLETALVELPLWRFAYRFRGEPYSALVDGSTGAVLASRYPAKSEGPFWVVAALGLSLFAAEGLAVSDPFLKAAVYGVTAVPLFLLAFWVARKV